MTATDAHTDLGTAERPTQGTLPNVSDDLMVAGRPSLSDRFVVPPFSVLDARQGYWQSRKKRWLDIGILSELGRGEDLQKSGNGSGYNGTSEWAGYRGPRISPGGTPRPSATLGVDGHGRRLATARARNIGLQATPENGWEREDNKGSGTSVFDPVICELAYRWWSPPGGVVLDPFAGGSVRGITAVSLGRDYVGIDLSARQLEANREQAKTIVPDRMPFWLCGDSRAVLKYDDDWYDFIFSCPPYADLEVYSDDPRDLSTMDHPAFRLAYGDIIRQACARLRPDRFACFVVGDVRNKRGDYYGLPGTTIDAFRAAGLTLYNDAVLVTAAGSLPIRAGKQFDAARKLGTTHQRVIVFLKGDAKLASAACGDAGIQWADPAATEER